MAQSAACLNQKDFRKVVALVQAALANSYPSERKTRGKAAIENYIAQGGPENPTYEWLAQLCMVSRTAWLVQRMQQVEGKVLQANCGLEGKILIVAVFQFVCVAVKVHLKPWTRD